MKCIARPAVNFHRASSHMAAMSISRPASPAPRHTSSRSSQACRRSHRPARANSDSSFLHVRSGPPAGSGGGGATAPDITDAVVMERASGGERRRRRPRAKPSVSLSPAATDGRRFGRRIRNIHLEGPSAACRPGREPRPAARSDGGGGIRHETDAGGPDRLFGQRAGGDQRRDRAAVDQPMSSIPGDQACPHAQSPAVQQHPT
jgi:hypothetical protein